MIRNTRDAILFLFIVLFVLARKGVEWVWRWSKRILRIITGNRKET